MAQAPQLVQVPKLGDPSPYVCSQCDKTFANRTPDDQGKIHRHLILHIPDSTTRWELMDSWLAAKNESDDATHSALS